MRRLYTCAARERSENELSRGNVYVLSQSNKVDLPKMPAFGY